MPENDNLTPHFFTGKDNPDSDEQIEEAVLRGNDETAERIVVSTKSYNEALAAIKKLKEVGVEAFVTEGGITLVLEDQDQLKTAQEVLQALHLKMELGKTQKEIGREEIARLNRSKRTESNAPNN